MKRGDSLLHLYVHENLVLNIRGLNDLFKRMGIYAQLYFSLSSLVAFGFAGIRATYIILLLSKNMLKH
jgi:hypothetical protein